MKQKGTLDIPYQKSEQLHEQKQKFVKLLLNQLKSLFIILVSTYIILLIVRTEIFYINYLLLIFLIILLLCDSAVIVLFILDMRRLINFWLVVYRSTHRPKLSRRPS